MSGLFRRNASPLAGSVRSVNYATSPLLAAKTPPGRSRLLVALMGLGFLVIAGRAVYVQVVGSSFFQAEGEKRYGHTLAVPASRGDIVDRNGVILATSVAVPSIWASPKEFSTAASDEDRAALARLLGMKPAQLADRLDTGGQFAWLKRHVDEDTAAKIKALKLKGVGELREYRRKYPQGEAAAHVVGFTNIEDRGQEGVELAFDAGLRGQDGSREVVKDRLGRVVEEDLAEQTPPRDGRQITLALDAKVQFFAYQKVRDAVREHKARSGSVVVLDARSGEVLALANYPSYDPAVRRNLNGGQMRNRALTDVFEPGSTMKPFVVAHALETRRVTPDTPIQTAPGWMTITGSTIRDAHPQGLLTVAGVLQKSSNVGTVKLAMQMSPQEMWGVFNGIGLGQKPDLGFPGAVSGRLRPYKTWRPIEQATMSYGYGLSVSLFQLARAYTVFAHDGELMPMSMTQQPQPPAGQRVFSPRTVAQVREMLQAAASPGGTAPLARTIGYSVGGKSGTARKQEGKAYTSDKYRSWFVGLAPISQPRIVVAVMVDEPGNGVFYGGAVAGPVFSQVVQQTLRTLGVSPDLDVTPQLTLRDGETAVPESVQP